MKSWGIPRQKHIQHIAQTHTSLRIDWLSLPFHFSHQVGVLRHKGSACQLALLKNVDLNLQLQLILCVSLSFFIIIIIQFCGLFWPHHYRGIHKIKNEKQSRH